MNVLNANYEVEHIYHLSDIHIRLYHRLDDEYEHVFQEMYKILGQSQEKQENCLIILTGDILHNKNDLSPECILTTLKFLNTLSSYYPTLLIAGNHDTLLNNLNRIDSLSAILVENHQPHLHYLKYSGYYQYGNIVFGVSSLLDNKWMLAQDISIPNQNNIKKVALYHGGVGRFSTNKGFVMEGVPIQKFDGYDMVMLGDIHLHQYLDKHKRIAYAGSMIAQNFGETDARHGVLKWHIKTNSSSFLILDNPYRYCEVVLQEDFLLLDGIQQDVNTIQLPLKGRVKIIIQNENKTVRDIETISILRNKFPLVQFNESRYMNKDSEKKKPIERNDNNMVSLVQNYFLTLPSAWTDKEKLLEVVLTYFKNNLSLKTNSSHFEILQVEFEYMFGYGAKNKIDFSLFQQNQTIGIFGMNSTGKSTLIEVIMFLLYGTITRYKHGQSIPPEVIHFQQSKSSGKIVFRSHNITYEISKKMTRMKTKIKVEEKLFKILPDGKKMDLSEEHRKKTDKFVISQIGTPSQFLFTNIFLQANEQSFRSMTPKERKEFLFEILELSQLEDEYQKHLGIWKENKQVLSTLERELSSGSTIYLETIDQHKKQLQLLQEEKTSIEEQVHTVQKRIRKKISLKKYCPFSSILEIDSKLKEIGEQYLQYEQEKSQLETFLKDRKEEEETDDYSVLVYQQKELWETIEFLYKERKTGFHLHFPSYCSQYPFAPSFLDETCFRQDVYENFIIEYKKQLQDQVVEEEMDCLSRQKEMLTLYPETDTKDDDRSLQDRLAWIQQNTSDLLEKELFEKKQTKKKLENELQELEARWQPQWKDWDDIQKERDDKTILSRLRFEKKCGACSCNQNILHDCLLQSRKLQEQKKILWNTISNSKEKHLHLTKEYENMCRQVNDMEEEAKQNQQFKEEMTIIQHVIHNRKVKKQMETIHQQLKHFRQRYKIQQDWKDMKELWEKVQQQYEIQKQNQVIEEQIQQKKKYLKILEEKQSRLDQYHKSQDLLVKIDTELENLKTKKSQLEEWKVNCQYNCEMEEWVQQKQEKEYQLQKELYKKTEEYLRKQQILEQIEKEYQQKQEKEEKYQELKQENEFLQHLLDILHRDGLPMYFLEKYLPHIEERINQLIYPFLPSKKLLLRREQKKETTSINMTIDTFGSETVYLGGMEGFIVDASIKEVLAEVSLQCKSNLFIIDEGISALDQKNMENIDQFFHFLEERHPLVFIISHLKEAQSIVKHSLSIYKEGDYSKIRLYL